MVLFEFKVRRYEETYGPRSPALLAPCTLLRLGVRRLSTCLKLTHLKATLTAKQQYLVRQRCLYQTSNPGWVWGYPAITVRVHVVIVVICDSESKTNQQHKLEDMPDI